MKQNDRGRLTAIFVLSALALVAVLVPLAHAQTSDNTDADCDGRVNTTDVTAVLDAIIGMRSIAPGCPLTNPSIQISSSIGTLAADASVTIADALVLAQCVSGQDTVACNDISPPAGDCLVNGVRVTTVLPQTQCDALVALYNSLDGPSWDRQDDWNTTSDPCTWRFVNCNAAGVFRLRLNANGLAGQMPTEIGALTNLDYLDLEDNQIVGMPSSFGNLTKLEFLNIAGNAGTNAGIGPLPASFGQLRALTTLKAGGAGITTLPTTFGGLTALVELDLGQNQIGGVPTSIGQLVNLEVLDLGSIGATSVPIDIGQLRKLRMLDFSFNKLTTLPNTFGNFTELTWLDVHANDLTTLPPSILTLRNIEELYVHYNPLGSLPSDLRQLTELRILRADATGLTTVPPSIGSLTKLVELNLERNAITALPTSIANLTALKKLNLSSNRLLSLPSGISAFNSLEQLYVQANQLRTLPQSISAMTQLRVLRATDNVLSGDIAPALTGVIDTLTDIRLSDSAGGNNCLTASNAATSAWLNANDPGWNDCN